MSRNDWPGGAQHAAALMLSQEHRGTRCLSHRPLFRREMEGTQECQLRAGLRAPASKYEPSTAILGINSHCLMFICGIYNKKYIKGLCEMILLRKTRFVECSEMHMPWDRTAALMVCSLWTCSLSASFPSQDITFPAPWLRRGRGGRVVTFCRKLSTTSPRSTPSLTKTALNQVRLGPDTSWGQRLRRVY